MTEKQKLQRNSFTDDFNAIEDDFILVDLDVMLDEEEPSPVPLNHFPDDEDVIDRLLIGANFNIADELELVDRKSNAIVIDDLTAVNELADFDEIVIGQAEQKQHIEIEKIPVSDFHPVADFDEIHAEEDAIDRLLVDAGFDTNDELEQNAGKRGELVIDDINLADGFTDPSEYFIEPIKELPEQNLLAPDEEILVSDVHSMADPDEITDEKDVIDRSLVDANDETEQDNEIPNMQVIDQKSRVNEFDVNFEEQSAMTADASNFGLGKSEVSLDNDATGFFLENKENPETVNQKQAISETDYPEKALESLNNDAEINTLRIIKTEQEKIKKQINDHENKVKKATTIAYASLSVGIFALLSAMVMGMIVSNMQAKISKLNELVSILEEDMSGIAEKNSDMGINNSDPSIEQLNPKVNSLQEQPEEQAQTSSGNSKKEMAVDVKKQAKINKSLDGQPAILPIKEKKKTLEAAKNQPVEKKSVSWSINLTAYEDLGFAKSKADKFLQKGIPVKIIAVDMNHKLWYRLKVGSFNNKEEASAYAAKIKKSLNLSSVSVDNN